MERAQTCAEKRSVSQRLRGESCPLLVQSGSLCSFSWFPEKPDWSLLKVPRLLD